MSCKCIQINKDKMELGQQLITPLSYQKRNEMINEIEENIGSGKFKTIDWNKLDDKELNNLYIFATVQCGGNKNMSLLGEDEQIHNITKQIEDGILKGFEGDSEITIGSYVKYSRNWLKSTGNFTGNLPRGIGKVINIEKLGKDLQLAIIQWNYKDIPDKVNVKNLILSDKIENV